jgi:hypothetical protein
VPELPDFPLHRDDLTLIAGPVTPPRTPYTRWTYQGPNFRRSAYRSETGRVFFVFHEGPTARSEAARCAAILAGQGAELRAARRANDEREVIMPWPPSRRTWAPK